MFYKIFPDQPRDANDEYYAHALAYLMALGEKHTTANWLPGWLTQGRQANANLELATQRLLRLCLTYFEEDDPRRIILLAATAFRRIFKLFLLSNEAHWRKGEILHFLERYQGQELSWNQILSSPEGHLIGLMDNHAILATIQFVAQHRSDRGEFKTEVAKLQLRDLWKLEMLTLQSIKNYAKLRKERNLGEMHFTEAAGVTFDYLGHLTLCLLPRFSHWKDYAMQEHRPLIEILASMNSWKARELLGYDQKKPTASISNSDLAKRFFYGDLDTLEALRTGYAGLR